MDEERGRERVMHVQALKVCVRFATRNVATVWQARHRDTSRVSILLQYKSDKDNIILPFDLDSCDNDVYLHIRRKTILFSTDTEHICDK